jgi:hypothetical protein
MLHPQHVGCAPRTKSCQLKNVLGPQDIKLNILWPQILIGWVRANLVLSIWLQSWALLPQAQFGTYRRSQVQLGNEPVMFQGNTQNHENVAPPPSVVHFPARAPGLHF